MFIYSRKITYSFDNLFLSYMDRNEKRFFIQTVDFLHTQNPMDQNFNNFINLCHMNKIYHQIRNVLKHT